jgi:WD40 repeat protein
MVMEKIEPNFHESWDNENKVFIELSESSLRLCQSNPIIQQSYWNYLNNKYVHSIFDPFAHYQDDLGETRLRKTIYFKSIANKDRTHIAYINKGEKKSFIEIHSITEHRHIQSIDTGAPGSHDCKFIDNNRQIVVGSDDGVIRIFDIETGTLVHKLIGHTDSVLCLDINSTENELISGSADGIWKLWSLERGDVFGQCTNTSEQLLTKLHKPIQIYHTQFSPDDLFIFVVTDIGRIQIFLRESLRLQTNLYDKYQRHSQASGEPTILSLLINSEEKCFYVGYANGKMQKWV